jgi:polyketide synthase 13
MTAAQLEAWIVGRLAQRLKRPAQDIDPVCQLQEYGLDSLEALSLTGEIELLLGRPVDPTVLWDHPSIRAVATFLAGAGPVTVETALPSTGVPRRAGSAI